MKSRYSRWDGTQDPFGPDLEIGDILDEISDDLLAGFGPDRSIRRLMREGISGVTQGLDDVARRVRRRRMELAKALDLEGPLNDLRDKLNEIVSIERSALAEEPSEDSRLAEATLDNLSHQPAQQLKQLMDYLFASAEAQERFNALVESMRQEVLRAYFGQLAGALQNTTPEDIARVRQMLKDLNAMIQARQAGQSYDFAGFMQNYGDMFPENPRNLDELLDVLAKRMAAMSRLMASLSPEQRRQLNEIAGTLLSDPDLALEMELLGNELRDLMPSLPWDQGVPSWGDEPGSLSGAVDVIEQVGELEELEETLMGDYAGAHIDDIDEDQLSRALGEESVSDVHRLKQIEKALEEAGVLSRNKGKLELTAKGVRRIGERALVKVFEDLRHEQAGSHESHDPGGPAEPTGATRRWQFGDVGEISVQKTVFNAVTRSAATGRGRVRLDAEDFELVEAESRTRTATALLLDLSFSMPLRGHWVPAKKMALALHALIEGKYPQDRLYLIGFSDYARRLSPEDLTQTGNIERVYGTNMQHAFLLARRLLSEHPRSSKQVIMVTDGEPTAHLVDGGPEHGPYAMFDWPPTSETIHKTLAEAQRLSTAGITLNIFMLEDEPGLAHFMDELARRTGGRVFQAAGRDLGNFVLRDFIKRRRA